MQRISPIIRFLNLKSIQKMILIFLFFVFPLNLFGTEKRGGESKKNISGFVKSQKNRGKEINAVKTSRSKAGLTAGAKAKTSARLERERSPANETAYSCTEHFQDKYSAGYIQIGYGCDPLEELCIAYFHIQRNRCDAEYLIRYFCDPQKESLFSSKRIKCDKTCEFKGLSGVCVK